MTDTPDEVGPVSASPVESHPQKEWFSQVRLVSGLTLLSRLLGLIRDIGMAALFGNGSLLDAFTLAFRLPNMSRRLFGEGALTAAFLPEYVKELKNNPDRANRLASAVICLLLLILSLIVLLGELGVYALNKGEFLGKSGVLVLSMTAWLLPYIILICLSAQFTAILHSQGHFAVPAFVPVLLNAVWIFAIWVVAAGAADQQTEMKIIIGAILVGGLGQLILPWWSLHRRGFRIQRRCIEQLPQAVQIFRMMIPVVIGLSISQLNSLCDGTLAWWYSQPEQGEWIASGTASALYYGQRLYQFPLGVFGIALGTVLFARLAHHLEDGQRELLTQDVVSGLRLTLTIGCPATVGLVLLAMPLADCLLRHGQFDIFDARQTAATIAAYGTAIWAFLGISIIQRVFYAMGDRMTPLRIGIAAVVINLGLNFLLMNLMGGVGLAYATAMSAVCQFFALLLWLRFEIDLRLTREMLKFLAKILLASALMGLVCQGVVLAFEAEPAGWFRLYRLALPLFCSVAFYWSLLKIMRVRELDYILGLNRTELE